MVLACLSVLFAFRSIKVYEAYLFSAYSGLYLYSMASRVLCFHTVFRWWPSPLLLLLLRLLGISTSYLL